MHSFWAEYVWVMGPFLAGLVGPGPDFVMIIRNSAANTRKSGVITAIGLGLGILTHATYAMFGLGILIAKSQIAINVIKYCGAAYISYIGISALLSRQKPSKDIDLGGSDAKGMSSWRAFRMGYITELLNPHAATFILSIFLSVQLSPIVWRVSYGLSMAFSSMIWYSIAAIFLTNKLMRQKFLSKRHIIDRVSGVILIGLAIRLLLAKITVVA
jgi:threonine/homoserine/homoserine lactone efflux protein